MTNQEYLIMCLNNEIDDDGASWESEIAYHIACPYSTTNAKGWCADGREITKEVCTGCKAEWLENEVDE